HAGRAAYDIEGLAAVAWLGGDPERAVRLYGAAAGGRARAKQRPERTERELHEGITAEVRAALGEDRFQSAWERGRRLSLEEAAAEALASRQSPRPGRPRPSSAESSTSRASREPDHLLEG